MRIIVKQCLGGFRARFDAEKRWGELAKSKAEAVGKLIMASPGRVGVRRIDWDRRDPWTKNYTMGKKNRRSFPPPSIDFAALPIVFSTEEAKALNVFRLSTHIPRYLHKVIEGLRDAWGGPEFWKYPITLGLLSQYTEAEIKEAAKPHQPIGKKSMEQLRQLLNHYSLSFKEE